MFGRQQSTLTREQNKSGWNKKGSCRLEGTWRGPPLPSAVHPLPFTVSLVVRLWPCDWGLADKNVNGSPTSGNGDGYELSTDALAGMRNSEMKSLHMEAAESPRHHWRAIEPLTPDLHQIWCEPEVTCAPSVVLDETTETLGLVLLTCKMACWKW